MCGGNHNKNLKMKPKFNSKFRGFKEDEKGGFIYSALGIVMVLIVAAIGLHLMTSSYTNVAKHTEQQKMINAINDVKSQFPNALKYAEYPAVWKVGHEMDSNGVNKYLSEGKSAMIKDLKEETASKFNEYLCENSNKCKNNEFAWHLDDITVTMKGIQTENVEVEEEQGTGHIKVNITVPEMSSGYRDVVYNETDFKVSGTVPVRLFKMYDKASAFHEDYESNVQWATTIALYLRAYVNAYTSGTGSNSKESFLKEGHVAYDPIDQIMRGDLESVKALSQDLTGVADPGSVPIATWLSEWGHLGEPNFLPPGIDLNSDGVELDDIVDTLKNGYDIDKASDCGSLPTQEQREECNNFNDPEYLEDKAKELKKQREGLEDLSDAIDKWEGKDKKAMTCDDFKSETDKLIEWAIGEFKISNPQAIIDSGEKHATGTELKEEVVDENKKEVEEVESAVGGLKLIQEDRLPEIKNSICPISQKKDCRPCPNSPSNCNDPDCNPITCPSCSDVGDCECKQYETGSRSETVNCKKERCKEVCTGSGEEEECSEECETTTWTENVKVDECNCKCHPTPKLIGDIENKLSVINAKIDDRTESLKKQEEEFMERAKDLAEAKKKLNEIEGLRNKQVEEGYDVVGTIDFNYVKFYENFDSGKCYNDPTWAYREKGTCGNKGESVGLYTAQVAAATICCALAQPCCVTVKYATEWFPAIYQVEGNYVISEKIVDDKNRVMLHNLAAEDLYGSKNDPQLYAHTAAEFQIYKDYEITAKSRTGSRVLVYLYLPKTSLNKVLWSFEDPTCEEAGGC